MALERLDFYMPGGVGASTLTVHKNSKCVTNLNVRAKTIKHVGENIKRKP